MLRKPGPRLENALIAILCLLWGSTWLVIREGLDDLPPLGSVALRFWVAALALVPVAPMLARLEGGTRPPLRLTWTMGTTNFAASYAILYWSEQTVPSGLACVLWGVFPILVAIGGHFWLPGERLSAVRGLGFVVGFAGVALLFAADLRAISAEAMHAGAILLLSPLVSSLGTIAVKRGGGGVSAALLTRDALVVGAVLVSIAAFLLERERPCTWTGAAVFSVVYLGVFGTVVTFVVYFWLMRYASAAKLSLIAYLTPALALTLGWAVRGEPIGATTIAGAALIVFGVGLAGRRRASR